MTKNNYWSCPYEDDCINKSSGLMKDTCLKCQRYERSRPDLYETDNTFKQALNDSFNKKTIF